MKKKSHTEYKKYTIENGVEINIPTGSENGMDMEQQQSYQRSNIVAKYVVEEKEDK